jgi:hypothetical protein
MKSTKHRRTVQRFREFLFVTNIANGDVKVLEKRGVDVDLEIAPFCH